MAQISSYILKDGSKRYKFKVYLGTDALGKRVETTRRGFKTKKAAKAALTQLQVDFKNGKAFNGYSTNKITTFDDLVKAWQDMHYPTIKPTSQGTINNYLKQHVYPFFGEYNLKKITPNLAQKFVKELYATKINSSKRICFYVVAIFKYGVKIKVIDSNPFDYVVYPKINQSKKRKNNYYTKDELTEFLNIVERDFTLQEFCCFRLLAYTGCRKSEVLGLKWNDFDFKKNTVQISRGVTQHNSQSYVSTPKTKTSCREIYLDQQTLKIVKRLKLQTQKAYLKFGVKFDNPFLFESDFNTIPSFNYALKVLNRVYRRNKDLRQITLHGFRHTHASLLFDAGATSKEVQHRLGHSSIATTLDTYTHLIKGKEKKTADIFAKYMEF